MFDKFAYHFLYVYAVVIAITSDMLTGIGRRFKKSMSNFIWRNNIQYDSDFRVD